MKAQLFTDCLRWAGAEIGDSNVTFSILAAANREAPVKFSSITM
jgi:hypothetical protein